MPQRCLGAGKGEGRRGVLPPGSGQGPEPGTRGMGAGWEVSLSASLHLPLLSFTPRSRVSAVRPWEGGLLCFAGFLCGLRGLRVGINLHKDPLRLGSQRLGCLGSPLSFDLQMTSWRLLGRGIPTYLGRLNESSQFSQVCPAGVEGGFPVAAPVLWTWASQSPETYFLS